MSRCTLAMRLLSAACLGFVLPWLCFGGLVDKCADDEVVLALPRYTFGYARILVGPLLLVCCGVCGCFWVYFGYEVGWACLCTCFFFIVTSLVWTMLCNSALRELVGIVLAICICGCCAYCGAYYFCFFVDVYDLEERIWELTDVSGDHWQQVVSYQTPTGEEPMQLVIGGGKHDMYEMFTLRDGSIHKFNKNACTWVLASSLNEGPHWPTEFIACNASFLYAISEQEQIWRRKFESVSDLSPAVWEHVMGCPFDDIIDACACEEHLYVLREDGRMHRARAQAASTAWEHVGDTGGGSAIAVSAETVYVIKDDKLHKAPNPMHDATDIPAVVTPQMLQEVEIGDCPVGTVVSISIAHGRLFLLEVVTELRCLRKKRKKASHVAPLPAQPAPQSIGLRSEAACSDDCPRSLDMVA